MKLRRDGRLFGDGLRGLARGLVVSLGTLVVLAPPARAESVDAIVAHGVELRRQGKDTEALAEFQRALKLESSPRVQAQAALAEQALGLWAPAEADLSEAVSHENDPWIKKNRPTLLRALAAIQGHLGTLEIWGTPADAEVFVNDKSVGKLPLGKPVRIAGDSILLAARADGYL